MTEMFEENDHTKYTNEVFLTWNECDLFISKWAKKKGFHIKKDRIKQEDGIIRRHTYFCDHSRSYDSKSKKESVTKKINCPFLINASCPKPNNPESHIYINKIVNEHNHPLSVEKINFEESKKFMSEIIDDIKFLTSHCKFEAMFWLTTKTLENDVASMSNWLDSQKECDPQWIVVRSWNKDNTLTKLLWMTPKQVENWIQFSDCILNDVIHKTNCYNMRLCGDDQEIEIPDASVDIICRHYFRIMLTTDNAKFHIWLILSRWYYDNADMSKEPFLKADKFYEEILIEETAFPISYLCAFNQDNQDFLEKSFTILQQRKIYGELHKFTESVDESSESSSEDETNSDKENRDFVLQNPKKRHEKG
ncbi:5859_t:CDS:2 [Cetraspora pellucida]|uniref:5859_t:CDS:1 n=1 Tax=Cetraspora pellucida TaxID=1433469 RepID=A0ACA9M7N9_9GLOM|nr:5859_t:CDS:2 [Cetraspora pellucida]